MSGYHKKPSLLGRQPLLRVGFSYHYNQPNWGGLRCDCKTPIPKALPTGEGWVGLNRHFSVKNLDKTAPSMSILPQKQASPHKQFGVLRITTVQESLESLLKGQMRFFVEQGYQVSMASAVTKPEQLANLEAHEGCKHYELPLTRQITPIKDLLAIWKTYRLIRNLRPNIVHTHTPKAGMVGMIAAWFARVPIRLHTVAGLPLMERTGFTKQILIAVERMTYRFATEVFPNSFGLQNYIFQHISSSTKIKVIGQGSSNGINIHYFSKTEVIEQQARLLREELGLSPQAFVWIFVGRMVKDKGINELIAAFLDFEQQYPNQKLLLVGPYEQALDPLLPQTISAITAHSNIFHVGFQKDIRPYLAVADALVFPSYREGFPNVPMQAACMGLPLILSDINGCNELIINNQSGLLIPPKSSDAIFEAMQRLYLSAELRLSLAREGQRDIQEKYSQIVVWHKIKAAYDALLRQ